MWETVSKIDGFWKTTFGWGITKTAHSGHFQSTQCSVTEGEQNDVLMKWCRFPASDLAQDVGVLCYIKKRHHKAFTGTLCELSSNKAQSWSEMQAFAFWCPEPLPPNGIKSVSKQLVLDFRHGVSTFYETMSPNIFGRWSNNGRYPVS